MKIFYKFIIIIVILYAVLAILNFVDFGFLQHEITAYPIHCNNIVVPHVCEDVQYALRPTIYKINTDRQEVLYWVQGFEVNKLTDCAVRDRKNWSCKFNDKSSQFGFTNGQYWQIDLVDNIAKNLSDHTQYISRIRWINQSCKDSWIVYPLCVQMVGRISD